MSKLVKILMERDDITKQEAENLIEETREEINTALEDGDFEAVEDIIACNLGLEPDYIFDLI